MYRSRSTALGSYFGKLFQVAKVKGGTDFILPLHRIDRVSPHFAIGNKKFVCLHFESKGNRKVGGFYGLDAESFFLPFSCVVISPIMMLSTWFLEASTSGRVPRLDCACHGAGSPTSLGCKKTSRLAGGAPQSSSITSRISTTVGGGHSPVCPFAGSLPKGIFHCPNSIQFRCLLLLHSSPHRQWG